MWHGLGSKTKLTGKHLAVSQRALWKSQRSQRNGKFALSQASFGGVSPPPFQGCTAACPWAGLSLGAFSLCKGGPAAKDISWIKNYKGHGDYQGQQRPAGNWVLCSSQTCKALWRCTKGSSKAGVIERWKILIYCSVFLFSWFIILLFNIQGRRGGIMP